MIRSRSSYGRDGRAIRSKIRRIATNATRARRSLSPRGTTKGRIALATTRIAPRAPMANARTCTAITRAGYRPSSARFGARHRLSAARAAAPSVPCGAGGLQQGCEGLSAGGLTLDRAAARMDRVTGVEPGAGTSERETNMLWAILVILLVLWALGLIGSIGGGFIHLLLVLAVIVLAVQLLQ